MACAPGSSCFGGGIVIGPSNPTNCGIDLCATPKSITDLVSYNGPNLSCSGINTCDNLTVALQKLDDKVCIQNIFNEFITYITNNTEIYNIFCSTIGDCLPTTTTTTTTINCNFNGGNVSYVEAFIMQATEINKLQFRNYITSTTDFYINWGDGNIDYFPAGYYPQASLIHIYSSPYTGPVQIMSVDLTGITAFWDVTYLWPGDQDGLVTTTTAELGKLDGFQGADFVQLTISGDVINLPIQLLGFVCWGKNQSSPITGDVANLPPNLVFTNILGANTLYGVVADFPRSYASGAYVFNVGGLNTISGDIADLPTTGFTQCSVSIAGYNTVTGDLANIPSNYISVVFQGNNTIYGNIADLQLGLKVLQLQGLNTVDGNVADFPSTMEYINIESNNTLYGNVDEIACPNLTTLMIFGSSNTVGGDISALNLDSNFNSLTRLQLGGGTSTSGDIAGLPAGIQIFTLSSNTSILYGDLSSLTSKTSLKIFNVAVGGTSTITGDIDNLPISVTGFSITGSGNTINTSYTPGHTFNTTLMEYFGVYDIVFGTTDLDNLLVDLNDAPNWQVGGLVTLRGTLGVPGTAAVASLTLRGVTVTITP